MMSIKRSGLLILAAGALVALVVQAQTGISDQGVRFPDGSVQTTADPCASSVPLDSDDEMILVGGVCIDKYEASVWTQPDGGTQLGVTEDDYTTVADCSDNGQDCVGKIYARSVEGETPSRFITWFQAQQALANSGKRLPTNAEWQMAVAGTPDNPNCNVNTFSVMNTGMFGTCESDWGAFDMVGNVWEWVADWGDNAVDCDHWDSTYGDDISCVGLGDTEANTHFPGALMRGGDAGGFVGLTDAGPFAVYGANQPLNTGSFIGFRGAR